MKISFKKTIIICSLLLFLPVVSVYGEENDPESAFKKSFSVDNISSPVPVVVEVPLSEWVVPSERFLVRENETGNYLRWYLKSESDVIEVPVTPSTEPNVGRSQVLTDSDRDTFLEFQPPESGSGEVRVMLNYPSSITTSRIDFTLDQYVALPKTVEIKYLSPEGVQQIALREQSVRSSSLRFPEITTNQIELTFTYIQPLRISEVIAQQENAYKATEQSLRFLAQPNYSYTVFYEADRSVSVRLAESGDLRSDKDVLMLSSQVVNMNPLYIQADVDGDGVPDLVDNCVRESNSDQEDIDSNGRGDVCDDWDRDGHTNPKDNCVNIPNRSQRDTDGDGIGDDCDDEESRFTERNTWVPWVGMGGAATVLLILFVLVIQGQRKQVIKNDEENGETEGEG